ncbi:glycosyltransferase [Boudabousia tangfeifanii]|nr:glycosyltransferase [Boudabousia tangfeifanii]
MSSKKMLLVFTDSYPYDVGEEFFEQEIEYQARNFDKILIVSQRVPVDAKQTRSLPDNASAKILPPVLNSGWLIRLMKNFFSIVGTKEPIFNARRWKNPVNALQDLKFASKLIDMRRELPDVLQPSDFAGFEDIVIYSYWFFTGVGLGAYLRDTLLKDKNVTIVSRAHAYDVDEKDAPFGFIPARSYLLSKADIVFPISNYASDFLQKVKVSPKAEIEVARLGVPAVNHKIRENSHPFTIVSCSHLAPYKRVDLLLQAVSVLQSRGYEVFWEHIGESDPNRLNAIKALARDTLKADTYLFRGYLANQEVRNLYESQPYSIFANVSDGEGVPVSIMEALASGLPVLATDAGGTRELVHDGINGWIIPVDTTPAQIADSVEKILEIPALEYQKISKSAIKTWDEMANAAKQYSRMAMRLSDLASN